MTGRALPAARSSDRESAPEPKIARLDERAAPDWDRFVEHCAEATFFHRAGWKQVIERSFGHRCHYLYAERAGRIEGVLPLVHMNSRLFGNALISTAFCVQGGPAAANPSARGALDAAAVELAGTLGVDHLEYRLRAPMHGDWSCESDLYATFRRALDPDPEVNLLAIPRKQRAEVRRAQRLGLSSEIDQDADRCYRIYGESLRNLGTPVFAKRYLESLKEVFAEACEILTVVHQGRAVSSVLSFTFRDQVLPYYGGGVATARGLGANHFMYWEVMRRACERGLRTFDFGRSKRGTGAYDFKRFFGFEPEPLHYEYKLLRRREVPRVNPLNPKYRALVALWRRLPLSVANRIGPPIARQLG
jgi:FemAB-related protein (PEP-CTERM system-associated)